MTPSASVPGASRPAATSSRSWGTSGGVEELEGGAGAADPSSRVQAVVDWFGPTDFARMGGTHDRPRLAGGAAHRRPGPGE